MSQTITYSCISKKIILLNSTIAKILPPWHLWASSVTNMTSWITGWTRSAVPLGSSTGACSVYAGTAQTFEIFLKFSQCSLCTSLMEGWTKSVRLRSIINFSLVYDRWFYLACCFWFGFLSFSRLELLVYRYFKHRQCYHIFHFY